MTKNNTYIPARAVIIDQGHIFLCKTLDIHYNFYFLSGDRVEPGESAANVLVREPLVKIAELPLKAEELIPQWLSNKPHEAFRITIL